MLLVNPQSAFTWDGPIDIHGVPMRGVPEKQGWAFSARGWQEARANPTIDADAFGRFERQRLRPLSAPTLLQARQEYAAKTVVLLPRYFIIEPTAFCNKACPFCSIHVVQRFNEHGEPGNTMMRWADFQKLMDEVKGHAVYGLSLYQLGEPLLWREATTPAPGIAAERRLSLSLDLGDMIDYAKQIAGFTVVNVSTNGDVPNLDLLLDCAVDDVIISIDGTTDEVYLANRPSTKKDDPGAFDRTLARVHTFLQHKAASGGPGGPRPYVRLQIINKADTAPQIVDFIRSWIQQPGVDDVYVKQLDAMTPWLGSTVVPVKESVLKMQQVGTMPCQHLWAIGSMTASGQFTACCHDSRSELTNVGANIRTSTFADWWHGPFMTQLRAEHAGGSFRMPCAACQERDPWLG